MTVYGTRAPSALSGALVDIIADVLRAPHWRAEVTAYGVDWHDERAGARVALRPGVMLVYRRGAQVLYMEHPRARELQGALVRAGVATSRTRAASAAARGRAPLGARAGAGAPWAGGRGSGGS
jgi:hypothetical protein